MSKFLEKDLQDFLWIKKDTLSTLFLDIELPDKVKKEKPWELMPYEILFNRVLDRIKEIHEEVSYIKIVSQHPPLSNSSDRSVYPDFLATNPETGNLVLIELKRKNGTERDAFTELLGYENLLKSKLSPLMNSNISCLLISSMQTKIAREAVIQRLIYDNKSIFVFQPEYNDNEGIENLKLRPWIPSLEDIKSIFKEFFLEKNFKTVEIAWYDPSQYWEYTNQENIECISNRMNGLAAHCALLMEREKIDGFVYCSQHNEGDSVPLPNSLIIAALDPYEITATKYLLNNKKTISFEEISKDICAEYVRLGSVLFGNNFNKDENTEGLFNLHLDNNFTYESIIKIAYGSVNYFCNSVKNDDDGNYFQSDHGLIELDLLLRRLSSHTSRKFNIYPTGLIRELYHQYSTLDYAYVEKNGNEDHPYYLGDDSLHNSPIDKHLNFQEMVDFIKRLTNPHFLYE